jgi:hypothetical protein
VSSEPDRGKSEDASFPVYPMTREQESQWLDDWMCDGPSRFLESWAYRLTGQLDIAAVEWAIGQVVARHEVLRSRLVVRDGELVQVVTPPGPVPLAQVTCSPAALAAELSRITAEPLDLRQAPLQPWLVHVRPDESVLVVQFHHAVVDDWALGVFQHEFTRFYSARLDGGLPPMEPVRMQVGDFAVAQRAAGLSPADLAYWQARLQDVPTMCTIPPDRPGPEQLPHRAGQHRFTVSPELGRAVRTVSRTLRTTPYAVFAGAMSALLWQYGEPEEVIVGMPMSLRGSAAVDGMLGCLSIMLPLRVAVSRCESFRALVGAAKAEVLGCIEHRAVSYAALVRMTRRGVDAEVPPLCHVALVVDDMRWEPVSLPGVTAERVYVPPARAKFDACFTLVAGDEGGYAGFCDYDADIYQATTIARAVSQFTRLLARLSAAVDEPLTRLLAAAAEPSRD